MTLPRFIAICGAPGSGKTETQKILARNHGYQPVDDGLALREIAVKYLGATWEQVSTPEGKKEIILINGQKWEVRDALGRLGEVLEQVFGGDVICEMALRASNISLADPVVDLLRYSFGSVRREQGHFYRRHGGIVIEIDRSGAEQRFEFDRYDPAAVQYTILNDAGLGLLERSVAAVLRWHETGDPRPPGFHPMGHGNRVGRGFYDRYFNVLRWRNREPLTTATLVE